MLKIFFFGTFELLEHLELLSIGCTIHKFTFKIKKYCSLKIFFTVNKS